MCLYGDSTHAVEAPSRFQWIVRWRRAARLRLATDQQILSPRLGRPWRPSPIREDFRWRRAARLRLATDQQILSPRLLCRRGSATAVSNDFTVRLVPPG